jgi:hypothetical protein
MWQAVLYLTQSHCEISKAATKLFLFALRLSDAIWVSVLMLHICGADQVRLGGELTAVCTNAYAFL